MTHSRRQGYMYSILGNDQAPETFRFITMGQKIPSFLSPPWLRFFCHSLLVSFQGSNLILCVVFCMYWQTHSLCMAKDWWCSVQRSAPTVTPTSSRTAVTFNGTSGPTKVWFLWCVSCTVFHCLITVWSRLPSVSPSWLSSRRTDVEGNWPVGQAQTKISMFLLLASSQRWKHFKSGNWQILHQSYETSSFFQLFGNFHYVMLIYLEI